MRIDLAEMAEWGWEAQLPSSGPRFTVLACEGPGGIDAYLVSDRAVCSSTVAEFGTNPAIQGSTATPKHRAKWARQAAELDAALNEWDAVITSSSGTTSGAAHSECTIGDSSSSP